MGGSSSLPYDAEIEYLESDGNSWIDTLENLQTACSTYIKMSITKTISSNALVFGAWMDGGTSITPKAQLYINPSQRWAYSRTTNIAVSGITLGDSVALNTVYKLTATTQSQENDLKAYLFARNNDGNDLLPIDGMRLYDCTMTKNDVFVRDFIPVRVGQVGYLYDKVSGQLFGNVGTGNFILGPDKSELFVDMGLPSGTLWAKGNIVKDANGNYAIGNETDYGCYFSWGNIVGHNEGEGYNFDQTTYDSTPGKQVSADIASNDSTHDAALATLGGSCRMPTKTEFKELYDNTDTEWTTIDGVNGRKFMKKSDHSVYIFFPATGTYDGTSLSLRGSRGFYWSASHISDPVAYNLSFDRWNIYPQNNYNRRYGFSVRAVK